MTDGSRELQQVAESRWRPAVVKPGVRTEALSRFLRNGTWRGTIPAGGAGPGSPEMDVVGRVTCERVIDGLWFSCTLEQDQFAGGEKVLTWKSHWVAGWDVAAQGYRAAGFDSNGVAAVFFGEIEGDRLIMESVGPAPMKLRLVWDVSDPGRIIWRNEVSSEEGVWNLIEEFVFTPEE